MKISLEQSSVFVEILLKQKRNKTTMKGSSALQRNLTLYPTPAWRAALEPQALLLEMFKHPIIG